ncbi:MAG: thioredoxin family protein [Planctomycetota bacterium]|nr:thioredoxin family protein [Planctomycetota bacterium]
MQQRIASHLLVLVAIAFLLPVSTARSAEKATQKPALATEEKPAELPWMDNYAKAMDLAKKERKMLLVHFHDEKCAECSVISNQLSSPKLRAKVEKYVLVRLPLGSSIQVNGKPVTLLNHASFAELRNGPGLAVIDLASKGQPYYGRVVSTVPTRPGKYFSFRPEQVAVLLELPAGTLTQRSMIFAVRIHPERPASAIGSADPILTDEATSHSSHQAQIHVQGHHQWGSRFQRILGRLSGRKRVSPPSEVVAESWPNQDLMDSCVDCVYSWRQSSGHWSKVRAQNVAYGYDIRRGSNGIWYATGIFAE